MMFETEEERVWQCDGCWSKGSGEELLGNSHSLLEKTSRCLSRVWWEGLVLVVYDTDAVGSF